MSIESSTPLGLLDINCVHRSFYYLGYDIFKCKDYDLSYWQIENMYNAQFNTDVVKDGGTKIRNVRSFHVLVMYCFYSEKAALNINEYIEKLKGIFWFRED